MAKRPSPVTTALFTSGRIDCQTSSQGLCGVGAAGADGLADADALAVALGARCAELASAGGRLGPSGTWTGFGGGTSAEGASAGGASAVMVVWGTSSEAASCGLWP
jgi:hypothetical protein